MNAQKVYSVSISAIKAYCNSLQSENELADKMAAEAIRCPEGFRALFPALADLGMMAREALEEIESKDGKKSILSTFKAVIKSASGCGRANIDGAWTDAEGWQNVCDGYQAFRVREPFASLPNVPGIDVSSNWDAVRRNNTQSLNLPTVGAVKAVIAEQKVQGIQKGKYEYDFGEGLPTINAEYLLNLLQLEADQAYINPYRPEISTLYVHTDTAEGLIMPIRKKKAK